MQGSGQSANIVEQSAHSIRMFDYNVRNILIRQPHDVDAALGKTQGNMTYNIFFANPYGFANRGTAAVDEPAANRIIKK